MTTAENGPRALEYLGLGDCTSNSLEGNVSNLRLKDCTSNINVEEIQCLMGYLVFDIYFQVSKVNLIITDYCMPGMTGFELLKKIKVV